MAPVQLEVATVNMPSLGPTTLTEIEPAFVVKLEELTRDNDFSETRYIPGGGVLPYMGYGGTCREIGYGFEVLSP